MAMTNWFPATYNPNYYSGMAYPYQQQYPQMQQVQPMQQQMQQTQAPQQSSPSSIIWINGISEAASYPVAPNNAVALWDSTAPSIYLKQADASGKPTLKIFDLVERAERPQETRKAEDVKTYDFATKSDLEGLRGAFEDELADIRKKFDKLARKHDDEEAE